MSKFTAVKCDNCPEDDFVWVFESDQAGILKSCTSCENHICDNCEDNSDSKCTICDGVFCNNCADLKWTPDENYFACPLCLSNYPKEAGDENI